MTLTQSQRQLLEQLRSGARVHYVHPGTRVRLKAMGLITCERSRENSRLRKFTITRRGLQALESSP